MFGDEKGKGMWHASDGWIRISELGDRHLINILCHIEGGRYPTPHRKFKELEAEAASRFLNWRSYMPDGCGRDINSKPKPTSRPASIEYSLEGLKGLMPGFHHILIKHIHLPDGRVKIVYQKAYKVSDRLKDDAVIRTGAEAGASRGRRSYD